MDDAGAGFPKTDPVFFGRALQKIVDFFVLIQGNERVIHRPHLRADEMVAMN